MQVVLVIPGAIDHNLVRQASRSEFGRLLKSGVQIYEYRPALLHAKTMVVDGIWATVGSTNLDHRSFALNEELNVAIYDADTAQRLERIFAQDLAELAPGDVRGLEPARAHQPIPRAPGASPQGADVAARRAGTAARPLM